MNHLLVTIEVPAYITVANIEADSGAHAVALASEMVDHKALIDRSPRQYYPSLPSGTVISVTTADVAISGVVLATNQEEEQISCSYEVASTGEIFPGSTPSRIAVIEAARQALTDLSEAYAASEEGFVRDKILAAIEVILATGIGDTPRTIEEQVSIEESSSEEENSSSAPQIAQADDQEEDPESLYDRIVANLPEGSEQKTFTIECPIFVSQMKIKAENSDQVDTLWGIDFGEFDIILDGEKVGAVGSWKNFADPNIFYFDAEYDILIAKTVILQQNDLPEKFDEKPNLPGKLSATFTID